MLHRAPAVEDCWWLGPRVQAGAMLCVAWVVTGILTITAAHSALTLM